MVLNLLVFSYYNRIPRETQLHNYEIYPEEGEKNMAVLWKMANREDAPYPFLWHRLTYSARKIWFGR